jgi:formylglycine-generating enzyme required for sulfatase activity
MPLGSGFDAAAQARCAGPSDAVLCDDGHARTSPVGHFKPNAFGLYDTTGSV